MKKVAAALVALIPTAVMASDISGLYYGISTGYATLEDKSVGFNDGEGWTATTDPSGITLSLFSGYNWILNDKFTIGVEASYDFRHANDTAYYFDEGTIDTDYPIRTTNIATASLRTRLGYSISESTHAFLAAGLAAAKVKRVFFDYSDDDIERQTDWQLGWTAGLGLEHAYSQNISARLEYNYADYQSHKLNVAMWDEEYKQNLTESSLKVGLVYKF